MTLYAIPRVCHRGGHRNTESRNREGGFTLIEVVVAIVLFSIISASAIAAISSAIKTSNLTRYRIAATNLAQQNLELARQQPTGLATATATASTAAIGRQTYTVSRNVSVSAVATPTGTTSATSSCPVGSVLQVSVQVRWGAAANQVVRQDTVIAC